MQTNMNIDMHRSYTSQARWLTAALGTLLFIYGCSNPSSGPSSGPHWNSAKSGSTFTFKVYGIDSLSISTFRRLVVDSIESSDRTIGGMTNVGSFQELSAGVRSRSLYYIAYANNGDFSFGDSASISQNGMNWATFPTGSRITTVKDTTFGTGTRRTVTISYVGVDSMRVAGTTLNVIKTQIIIHESSASSTSDQLEYWWYAPELGFFTQIELQSLRTYTDSFGKLVHAQSGVREVLDSYKLQ
jgi:hypothetical protein